MISLRVLASINKVYTFAILSIFFLLRAFVISYKYCDRKLLNNLRKKQQRWKAKRLKGWRIFSRFRLYFSWMEYVVEVITYLLQRVMEKDFDAWNNEKKVIHALPEREFYVRRWEIRYVKLWLNVGYEQDGKHEFKRPVLVVKKLWWMFLVLPMTTKGKKSPFYYQLQSTHFPMDSYVIMSQIRALDKKRFIERIGCIGFEELTYIKKNLSLFCFSD